MFVEIDIFVCSFDVGMLTEDEHVSCNFELHGTNYILNILAIMAYINILFCVIFFYCNERVKNYEIVSVAINEYNIL